MLFNDVRGSANLLQMAPPFAFSDVTMSVFPLRASLPTLDAFCRNYLNQAPELVEFRPFIPFVYLVILDYGRMSVEAANMGWISQREVAFGVPLRWLNSTPKGQVFFDWAFTSPFIFVDNELSMSTGREVYGWPKLLARLDPTVSEWVHDPHGARRVFQVSTKGTEHAYSGETSAYRPILSVYQHRNAGLLDIPPSLETITRPLAQWPDIAMGLTRLGTDLTRTFLGMASDRITGSPNPPDLLDMAQLRENLRPDKLKRWTSLPDWSAGVAETLWSLFPRLYANTINFKQFRDASNPMGTCYQAITAARMPIRTVKQGGFLGPHNMMLGQLDGGFEIDIHQVAGLPLVECLGLEVASERTIDGTAVSRLTPLAPLWFKVDMTYGLADTLVWRGRTGGWQKSDRFAALQDASGQHPQKHRKNRTGTGRPDDALPDHGPVGPGIDRAHPNVVDRAQSRQAAEPASGDGKPTKQVRPQLGEIPALNVFNTTRGSSEAVGGAFSIPDASVRILPLKADFAALQRFAKTYLEIRNHMRFQAWGDHVYLVINDFQQMYSQQSASAKRSAREVSLLVPVKCYDWYEDGAEGIPPRDSGGQPSDVSPIEQLGREKLLTTGFVNAFTFVDDSETAVTANEVYGVPSMGATIRTGKNDWLTRNWGMPRQGSKLLSLSASVLPELIAGAKAVDRPLIELGAPCDGTGIDPNETADSILSDWVERLVEDLRKKRVETDATDPRQTDAINTAQGFALQLMVGETCFNQFSLKQFRDSLEPGKACYQGLILRRHRIAKLDDLREIRGPIEVAITDYPTQPIAELLGLQPKYTYPGRDRIVRVFEALRPFALNGHIERANGATLFERTGTGDWEQVDVTEQVFGWRTLAPTEIEDLAKMAENEPDTLGTVELLYEEIDPTSTRRHRVHLRQATPPAIVEWFKGSVLTDHLRWAMLRHRGLGNGIKMPCDAEMLSRIQPGKTPDLAAAYRRFGRNGTLRRQDDLAGLVERISPATLMDMTLSRQCGKAPGSLVYDHDLPDFCVPTATLPENRAAVLMPQIERQGPFWPAADTYRKEGLDRLRNQSLSFKQDLLAHFRLLSLALTQRINEKSDVPKTEKPDTADFWQVLQRGLNTILGPGRPNIPDKLIDAAIALAPDTSDWRQVSKALETLTFAFFDAYLPETFKLGDSEKAHNPMLFGFEVSLPLYASKDWSDLCIALGAIRADTTALLDDGTGAPPLLDQLLQTASQIHRSMAELEDATGRPANTIFAEYDPAVYETRLLKRLDELLTGRLAGTQSP